MPRWQGQDGGACEDAGEPNVLLRARDLSRSAVRLPGAWLRMRQPGEEEEEVAAVKGRVVRW